MQTNYRIVIYLYGVCVHMYFHICIHLVAHKPPNHHMSSNISAVVISYCKFKRKLTFSEFHVTSSRIGSLPVLKFTSSTKVCNAGFLIAGPNLYYIFPDSFSICSTRYSIPNPRCTIFSHRACKFVTSLKCKRALPLDCFCSARTQRTNNPKVAGLCFESCLMAFGLFP